MAKRKCRPMALVNVPLSSLRPVPASAQLGRASLSYDQCSPCWISIAPRVLQYHQPALTAGEKEGSDFEKYLLNVTDASEMFLLGSQYCCNEWMNV